MINAKNAAHHAWGEGCDAWRLLTSPELGIIQERVPPGSGETRHVHRRARQFFFVLAGTASFELAGQWHVLHARDGIEVPPNAPHLIRNDSLEVLEFLVIAQPDSRDDRAPA
jgi:mannose-6-phosphate isomerase-like protein (cupin superfamily)